MDYRNCTIPDRTQGREKYKSNYASCSGQISSVKTIRHKSPALINSARPKNHGSTCLSLRCVMSYWSKCAGKQEYIKSTLFRGELLRGAKEKLSSIILRFDAHESRNTKY